MSDTPHFEVRRLTDADIGLFRELLGVFGAAFEDPETYTANQPGDGYLTSLLRDDGFFAVAALHSDTVIGGLTAYQLKKFEQERSEIYIYDLAVTAAQRRRGVATALIDHLKFLAAVAGAYVVIIQADQGDEPAVNLYSKLGTREAVLHFDIDVD